MGTVGDVVGRFVGIEGATVGEREGDTVGESEGDTVGETKGDTVGENEGDIVGDREGATVGWSKTLSMRHKYESAKWQAKSFQTS